MYSSPSYTFYHNPSTLYSPQHFPTEFQSNYASIRTSGPGAALIGLGIECPQLSISQSLVEPLADTSLRSNLYSSFSSAGFFPPPAAPPKRNYLSTKTCPSLSSSPPMLLQDLTATKGTGSPESGTSLSFRVLSAASGLSPEVLANQISATAEIALQLMSNSQPTTPCFGTKNWTHCDNESKESSGPQAWSIDCILTPEMVAPVADINMRQLMLSHQETVAGVNPADTLPCYALSSVSPAHLDSEAECVHSETSFADAEDNDGNEDAQESVSSDEMSAHCPVHGDKDYRTGLCYMIDRTKDGYGPETWLPFLEARTLESFPFSRPVDGSTEEQPTYEEPEPSEYEPSVLDCPSDLDASPASPGYRFPRQKFPRRRVTLPYTPLPGAHTWPVQPVEVPNVDLGTPVFNAHVGVTLTELQEKAERYRLRNNMLLTSTGEIEHQYDRRWLLSFVGRLSEGGEITQVYRCYVIGCAQTNKRRDHILIHLGGHLGQRPFKCVVCPARFLRKNECKRHELSHSGERPFICNFCQSSFVRQDLLKRHVARTHSSKGTPAKRKLDGDTSSARSRKRSRTN